MLIRTLLNLLRGNPPPPADNQVEADPEPSMRCPMCRRPMVYLPSNDPIFDRFACGYCYRKARQYRADAAATTKQVERLRKAQQAKRKRPRPTIDPLTRHHW